MCFAEQRPRNPLVQEHCQYRNNSAFHQIQRCHADHDEGGYIVDASVNIGTHTDDRIQRNAVKLGKFGDQVDGIKGAAEDGHAQAADDQTDDGTVSALVGMIDDGGGQHKGATHGKIGKVTHKCGGGTLKQQLQNDFDTLTGDGCRRTEIETAQQDGQF